MATMVPDRGDDPKRKHIWDVHNQNTGDYQYSFMGGQNLRQATKNKHYGANLENELTRGQHRLYPVDPKTRKFK